MSDVAAKLSQLDSSSSNDYDNLNEDLRSTFKKASERASEQDTTLVELGIRVG